MGVFGRGEKEDKQELAQLRGELGAMEAKRKKLASELAQERMNVSMLGSQLEQSRADLERMKLALVKARQRQKASVERANRFKARSATLTSA